MSEVTEKKYHLRGWRFGQLWRSQEFDNLEEAEDFGVHTVNTGQAGVIAIWQEDTCLVDAGTFEEHFSIYSGAYETRRQAVIASRPTVGRDVHYVAHGSADGKYPQGKHRAAKVTDVPDGELGIHLFVMNPTGTQHVFNVIEDPEGKTPGTWHWPERV